jgi:Reverse transcriptase (RNA-dependent DNA polymerase)
MCSKNHTIHNLVRNASSHIASYAIKLWPAQIAKNIGEEGFLTFHRRSILLFRNKPYANFPVNKTIRLNRRGCLVDTSYLSGRRQLVRFDRCDSEVGRVTCGMPQVSVLGPKIFSYYIKSVSRVIINCRFNINADDLQLYKSCSVENFQQCIDDVNSDLAREHVHTWAKSNELLLNPTKSQVIVV